MDIKEIDSLLPLAIGGSFGMLWALQNLDEYPDVLVRRERFFECINVWMRCGKLLLHRRGVLLTGTIDEQLALFRRAFPNNDADIDLEVPYGALWFYMDECPAEPVWIIDNGRLNYC